MRKCTKCPQCKEEQSVRVKDRKRLRSDDDDDEDIDVLGMLEENLQSMVQLAEMLPYLVAVEEVDDLLSCLMGQVFLCRQSGVTTPTGDIMALMLLTVDAALKIGLWPRDALVPPFEELVRNLADDMDDVRFSTQQGINWLRGLKVEWQR